MERSKKIKNIFLAIITLSFIVGFYIILYGVIVANQKIVNIGIYIFLPFIIGFGIAYFSLIIQPPIKFVFGLIEKIKSLSTKKK